MMHVHVSQDGDSECKDNAHSASESTRTQPRQTTRTAATVVGVRSSTDDWSKLRNLMQLRDLGLLSAPEFERRKRQLVDRLTGSTDNTRPSQLHCRRPVVSLSRRQCVTVPNGSCSRQSTIQSSHTTQKKQSQGDPSRAFPSMEYGSVTVRPGPPPDWSQIPRENAIRFDFDARRDEWRQTQIQVKLAAHPFARGSLRYAYHLLDTSNTDTRITRIPRQEDTVPVLPTALVAKVSVDPCEPRDTYFQDVAMQRVARLFAKRFNRYKPPKRVAFVEAWVVELTDRPGKPLCAVEPYITGKYRKHNNNYGFVDEAERSTPQAFSHFSYESSGRALLICDVQGVSDLYTDPQIHSRDGEGFGKGNMGLRGFERFVMSHKCNAICAYLRLPPINPRNEREQLLGTLPNRRFTHKAVEVQAPSELRYDPLPKLLTTTTRNDELPLLGENNSSSSNDNNRNDNEDHGVTGSRSNGNMCCCSVM
ncbi:MAG: hypothetical protein MHM6MM_002568 [Cercozoa sp. M6MM]